MAPLFDKIRTYYISKTLTTKTVLTQQHGHFNDFPKKNFFFIFCAIFKLRHNVYLQLSQLPSGKYVLRFFEGGGGARFSSFVGGGGTRSRFTIFGGGIFGRTTKTTNLEGRGVKALVLQPIRKSLFLRLPLSIYVRKLFLWTRGGVGSIILG